MIPDRATVAMACIKASTVNGVATAMLKVPSGGRKINGGIAWFENHHQDDKIMVYISLENGTVISGYTDDGVPDDNKGWFIPSHTKEIKIERLVDFGTLPENLYIKIVGIANREDTLRVNLHWGKAY